MNAGRRARERDHPLNRHSTTAIRSRFTGGRTDSASSARAGVLLAPILTVLEEAQVPFHDLQTEQHNLEDVFLALTGREMRD